MQGTSGKVHDVVVLNKLPHGEEGTVFADSGDCGPPKPPVIGWAGSDHWTTSCSEFPQGDNQSTAPLPSVARRRLIHAQHVGPHRKHTVLRQATVADLPGIWRVRYAVQENLLAPGRISDEDVRREIEDSGRGWVVERGGEIKAFAICNGQTGNVWALFVHPDSQGVGYGSMLHDQMLRWLATCKVPTLWLTTGPNTRARGFYERRGWVLVSAAENEDSRFEHPNST